MMKTETVVILGGAGAVGTMLKGLLRRAGYRPLSVDKRAPLDQPDSLRLELASTSMIDQGIFNNAAAVIFALPENVALHALPQVLQALRSDVLLVPTCSVQGPFHAALKGAAPTQPWLGINPMFSPSLDYLGRTVAICLDDIQAPVHWMERLLSEAGMSIRRMTVKHHDQSMALCQALPHAAVIAFGMALAKSGANLETLLDIAPPPMRTMMALLSRMLSNPMEVYWDIQYENPSAAEQRDVLVEALTSLKGWVHDNDQKAFANALVEVARQLGGHRASGASECQRMFSLLNEFGPESITARQDG